MFDNPRLFILNVSVYVSNLGIVMISTGVAEDIAKDTVHLSWVDRLLNIGDRVSFQFQSGYPQSDKKEGKTKPDLVSVPKCAFSVSSTDGLIDCCDNSQASILQFELHWDSVTKKCSMTLWNGNMLVSGEIEVLKKIEKEIESGQIVELEIKPLTRNSNRRKIYAA